MTLELRRVALGQTLSDSERGPTLIGACIQAFDNKTNTTQILVKLNNSAGLLLNATEDCSDCCGPKGNAGMFGCGKCLFVWSHVYIDVNTIVLPRQAWGQT